MAACWERGQQCQRNPWSPSALQRCGAALYRERNLWEVLFGCPFSLKHYMNLRWNSTVWTADASYTTSTSYLSASEKPQALSAGGFLCVCVYRAYLAYSDAAKAGLR